MTKHLRYLRYVLRHKRFVLQAGLRLHVPLWQLLVHDLSKFRPDEWGPYAEWFYGYRGGSWYGAPNELVHGDARNHLGADPKGDRRRVYDRAWLKHQHRNPHHWQHWVLQEDSGKTKVLPMPDRYRREMLADWIGAGRAIHGDEADTAAWYCGTKAGRQLHPDTLAWVEGQLGLAPEEGDSMRARP